MPGVPDVYQGTELWDFSLVDPDNRRPVDYARGAGAAGRARRRRGAGGRRDRRGEAAGRLAGAAGPAGPPGVVRRVRAGRGDRARPPTTWWPSTAAAVVAVATRLPAGLAATAGATPRCSCPTARGATCSPVSGSSPTSRGVAGRAAAGPPAGGAARPRLSGVGAATVRASRVRGVARHREPSAEQPARPLRRDPYRRRGRSGLPGRARGTGPPNLVRRQPDSDPPRTRAGDPQFPTRMRARGEAAPCLQRRPAGHRFARTRQLTSQAVIGGSPMSQHFSMTRARGRRTCAGAVVIGAAAIGIGALRRAGIRGGARLDRCRPVRVQRQLEHQHRQRVLRRAAVQPVHLGGLRRQRPTPPAPTSPRRRSRSPSRRTVSRRPGRRRVAVVRPVPDGDDGRRGGASRAAPAHGPARHRHRPVRRRSALGRPPAATVHRPGRRHPVDDRRRPRAWTAAGRACGSSTGTRSRTRT